MLNPLSFTAEEVEIARHIADAWGALAATLAGGGLLASFWGGVRRWAIAGSCVLGSLGLLAGYGVWHFMIPRSVEAFRAGISANLHGVYAWQPAIPSGLTLALFCLPVAYALGGSISALTMRLVNGAGLAHPPPLSYSPRPTTAPAHPFP